MEQTQDWPKAVTVGVAREVRRYRRQQGMSTEQLSARTAAIGHQIHRSVIAKLESGHRESITVPDLVMLARALGVPPLSLLYPVGREGACEVLPGVQADPWDAAKLFTGEMAGDNAMAAASDLGLYRQHDEMVRHWLRAHEAEPGEVKPEDIGGVTVPMLAEIVLLNLRDRMRDRGLTPPALPEALAAVMPQED